MNTAFFGTIRPHDAIFRKLWGHDGHSQLINPRPIKRWPAMSCIGGHWSNRAKDRLWRRKSWIYAEYASNYP